LNQDGSVTIQDLAILLSDFGCTADCMGDLDSDNDTDLSDLTLLLSVFGTSCP
jgi:hypothetical protein